MSTKVKIDIGLAAKLLNPLSNLRASTIPDKKHRDNKKACRGKINREDW